MRLSKYNAAGHSFGPTCRLAKLLKRDSARGCSFSGGEHARKDCPQADEVNRLGKMHIESAVVAKFSIAVTTVSSHGDRHYMRIFSSHISDE